MNKLVLNLNIVLLLISGLSLNAYAVGYEARQKSQDKRIEQGIQSGELTNQEVRNLERGQNRIDRKADRLEQTKADAKADGHIDKSERRQINSQRAQLHRTQDRQSKNIRAKKHNNRR